MTVHQIRDYCSPKALLLIIFLVTGTAMESVAQGAVQIPEGTTVALRDGVRMRVAGDWVNNGRLVAEPGSQLVLIGQGIQRFSASEDALYNLTVMKPSGHVVLESDLSVLGLLSVTQGGLDLNGHHVELGTTGFLVEMADSRVFGESGTIAATGSVDAGMTMDIAGLGASINVDRTLDTVRVTRGHQIQTISGQPGIARYFEIVPNENRDLDATLVFRYHDSELGEATAETLVLWRSVDGGDTFESRGGVVDTTGRTVTLAGINAFSRWTLAPAEIFFVIGETGMVTVNQADRSVWHRIDLSREYHDPVVIMGPLSFNDSDPATVRVRNIEPQSFEFQIQEWNYLDGAHDAETVSYLVVEAGDHLLDDGRKIMAGFATAGPNRRKINFGGAFAQIPVAVSQIVSTNDPGALVTRQTHVSRSRVEVFLQAEEARQAETEEQIAWLAMQPAGSMTGGRQYLVGRTGRSVQHTWFNLPFRPTFSESPVFLAAMQTILDPDPATIRYRNLIGEGVQIFIEEEPSLTPDITHLQERVGYFAFEAGPLGVASAPDLPWPIIAFEPEPAVRTIPARGASVPLDIRIENPEDEAVTADLWFVAGLPAEEEDVSVFGPVSVMLGPNESVERGLQLIVPFSAPAGEYTFSGLTGVYPELAADGLEIDFIKEDGTDESEFHDWAILYRDTGLPLGAGDEWVPTNSAEAAPELPAEFMLHANYPNPFNPSTTIRFELPIEAQVQLRIFDILGREIARLLDDELPAGNHRVMWSGRDAGGVPVASGVYIYHLRAGDFRASRTMVLAK